MIQVSLHYVYKSQTRLLVLRDNYYKVKKIEQDIFILNFTLARRSTILHALSFYLGDITHNGCVFDSLQSH